MNTDLPVFIDRAVDLACHEGYPGPSRLQRAAREAPGARSRLDGVHGLSAVLAAVADRRGHRQLRHRGRVLAPRSDWPSSATCCSRWPASTATGRKEYYEVLALVDRLSYAGNEAARRYLNGTIDRAGAADVARALRACTRSRGPSSACGSSTSTGATSSTTTSGRTWSGPTSRSRPGASRRRRGAGARSRRCCPRRACPRD